MDEQTIALKALIRQRHMSYEAFCRHWDRIAPSTDDALIGHYPGRAQYYRWLRCELANKRPYPDACRMLEAMFPEWSVESLFSAYSGEIQQAARPPDSVETGKQIALDCAIELTGGHETRSSVTAAYSGRGLVTRQQWNRVIEGASECVWLYGMAEFGYATDDDVPGLLSEASSRGCKIQVLLLDPEYSGVAEIDADEGSPPGTLSTRIRAAMARFLKMKEACGMSMTIRVYDSHPTVSVIRGDDRMIVTPYLRFFTGSNSPTFELRSESSCKIFDRYVRHFEEIWRGSKEWK